MSTMAGAALGAHNAAIFLDWELRCGGQLNSASFSTLLTRRLTGWLAP